jgi:hypothetical protein
MRRHWTRIIAGVVIAAIALPAIAIGGTALLIRARMRKQIVAPAAAVDELRRLRAREQAAGPPPLLEVDPQAQLVVHRSRAERQAISALHTVTYDPSTRTMIRTEIPGWLLRVATIDGRIRLVNIDIIQRNGERLTLEDLERHGPGIIMSVDVPRGRQALVWIE